MTQTTPTGTYGTAFTNGYGAQGATPTQSAQSQASHQSTWAQPWNQSSNVNPANLAMNWFGAPWNAASAWNQLPYAGFNSPFGLAMGWGVNPVFNPAFNPTFNQSPQFGGNTTTPYGFAPNFGISPIPFGYSPIATPVFGSPYPTNTTFNTAFGTPWNNYGTPGFSNATPWNPAGFNSFAPSWGATPWLNHAGLNPSAGFAPNAGFTPNFGFANGFTPIAPGFNPFTHIAPQVARTPVNHTGAPWNTNIALNAYAAPAPYTNPFSTFNPTHANMVNTPFGAAWNPNASYAINPVLNTALSPNFGSVGFNAPGVNTPTFGYETIIPSGWAGTGINSVVNPTLNLLASTNPMSLAGMFSPSTIRTPYSVSQFAGISPLASPLFNEPIVNPSAYPVAQPFTQATPWTAPVGSPYATNAENLQQVSRDAA